MLSPRVLQFDNLLFRIRRHDAPNEHRESVHVGIGSQDDANDAKIWLEPTIEIGRRGKTLRQQELNKALRIIKQQRAYLAEQWHEYKGRAD